MNGRGDADAGAAEHRAQGDAALAQFNKRIDIAIAEFNALRAEMHNRMTAQAALVGVALTALGVIFGFVIKDNGDNRLLLAVPPLAALVSLLHAAESHRIARIGDYIREELWPYLQRRVGAIPSWESGIGDRRRGGWVIVRSVFLDGPATAILFLASVGSQLLIQSRDPNFNGVDHTAWKLDWAATAVALAAPIVTGIAIRRNSNKAHDAAGGACQEPDVREAAEEIDASAASDRET